MRADRLISIIMLLQTREKMTAQELSKDLEVSQRTIYRDVTALNVAGIPVYTDRGPGGGIALLESYRTTLTGMSEDEARALFMLSIPQSLVDLGFDQKLRSALLKLTGALPPGQKMVKAHTEQRVYLDSTSWSEPEQPSPHLGAIHQAVWQDKRIRLVYQGSFDTRLEFELEPLGLVAKMNSWYLVGRDEGYLKVHKIDEVIHVDVLEERFIRDESFDLSAFWQEWCISSRKRRSMYKAQLRVAPGLLSKLHFYLGEAVKYTITDDVDCEGWKVVTIIFEDFFKARESILNFGRAAKVLEPGALRLSVVDFARQIVDLYEGVPGK